MRKKPGNFYMDMGNLTIVLEGENTISGAGSMGSVDLGVGGKVICPHVKKCLTFAIWDHALGEMLVNQIPLICSYEQLNDLLLPFRHLRDGTGMGSLFCLRNTDQPKTADPAKGNLTEFQVLWGGISGQDDFRVCFPKSVL